MQSPKRIKAGFNFFALFYDFASFIFFGNSILKSQTALLPDLKKCRSVLIFGGGTGKLLIEVLKQNVGENYSYLDISDQMILKSQKRLKKYFPEKINAVKFVASSIENISATQKFDLIITPCVLDCFTEEKLPGIMQQLKSHLNEKGEWLFVDFNIPENKKTVSAFKIRVMYFFFNVICGLGVKQLPDFSKEFEQLDMEIKTEKYFLNGLIVSRIYQ